MIEEPKRKSVLELAAEAAWNAHRKHEIKELSDIEFDHSAFVKCGNMLVDASPRVTVILSWALISHCLDFSIRHHLSHSTKKEASDFMDGFGSLSSDAAKLKLARLLGWLPKIVSDGAEAIRRTRNRVAHEIMEKSEIPIFAGIPNGTCEKLDVVIQRIVDADEAIKGIMISDRSRFKVYAILISQFVFESVLCGPAKLRLGISGGVGTFFDFDEGPDWSREFRMSATSAILKVLGVKIEKP